MRSPQPRCYTRLVRGSLPAQGHNSPRLEQHRGAHQGERWSESNLNAPRAARNTEHAVPTAPRIHKVAAR